MMVWPEINVDTEDIFGLLLDSTGSPIGTQIQISDRTLDIYQGDSEIAQQSPYVAVSADNSVVMVAWDHEDSDGFSLDYSGFAVMAAIFSYNEIDSKLTKTKTDFVVNQAATGWSQYIERVFVVLYLSAFLTKTHCDHWLSVYDKSGTKVLNDIKIFESSRFVWMDMKEIGVTITRKSRIVIAGAANTTSFEYNIWIGNYQQMELKLLAYKFIYNKSKYCK